MTMHPSAGPVNMLFTSVGRRVELLRAFRRAYEAVGIRGAIIAVDMDPLAPALQVADRSYIVPRVTHLDYLPALGRVCARERITLVVPLIDPEIPVLARSAALLENTGARVVVVSPTSAEITCDKVLTYRFFRSIGIPTPATWLPEEIAGMDVSFPVFVKPRVGSAGEGAFAARNERELSFFLEQASSPVVQEYLPGPEITTDVLCDLAGAGKVLSVVSRQRIEVRQGEVAKGVTIHDGEIQEHCVAIAEALEAIGPITVQCLRSKDRPYFTEVNPRFGGGVPLAIAAGANVAEWLLSLACGIQVQPPPLGSYETGLYLTRFDDSFFVSEQRRAEVAKSPP
jgi:carbamoyl-phosphate synthase large subunit